MGAAMNRCLKCKTENAPGAEYCTNCGFSLWQDAPAAETALEAPTRIMRLVRLTPDVVSVRRGERSIMTARLDGDPGIDVEWELEGSASAFATVEPRSDGALIHLHPDQREPAWASPLEVRMLEFGQVSGVAWGTVEVLAEAVPEPAPQPRPEPEPQPVPQPQPEPEPAPASLPEPEPVPWPDPEPLPKPEPWPEPSDRPSRAAVTGQLIALAACAVLVVVAYAVHRFIDYGGGWDSLWGAARHGGDSSSPLHPADFWTIVGPAIAAFVLTGLSLLGARRFSMSLVAVLGILIVAQVLAIGLIDRSLRERLAIGVVNSDSSHTPGMGFLVVLVAGFVLVVAAAVAVAAPRDPPR
jgi:hypothetical protein